jgi:hypothetical protein
MHQTWSILTAVIHSNTINAKKNLATTEQLYLMERSVYAFELFRA